MAGVTGAGKWQWSKRLLRAVGSILVRASRLLKREAGLPAAPIEADTANGPPKHWLDLLSSSKVPLVWMQREAGDEDQGRRQEDWQPHVLWPQEIRQIKARNGSRKPSLQPDRNQIVKKKALAPEPSLPHISTRKSFKPFRLLKHRAEAATERSPNEPDECKQNIPAPHINRTGPHTSPPPLVRFPELPQPKEVTNPERNARVVRQNLQILSEREAAPKIETHDDNGIPSIMSMKKNASSEIHLPAASHRPERQSALPTLFTSETLSADHWPALPDEYLPAEPFQANPRIEAERVLRLEQEQRGEQNIWNG